MQIHTLTTVDLAGFHKEALLIYLRSLTILNVRNKYVNYVYQFRKNKHISTNVFSLNTFISKNRTGKHNFCHIKINLCFLCVFLRRIQICY